MKKDAVKRNMLIEKLVKIMHLQEMDIYDDFQDLPQLTTRYFNRIRDIIVPKSIKVICKECRLIVEYRKHDNKSDIDRKINTLVTDLDKPVTTSEIGSIQKMEEANSEIKTHALQLVHRQEIQQAREEKERLKE